MSVPRRVLFADQWEYVAGAQVVLLELLAHARDWGWEVHAAVPLGGALEAVIRDRFGGTVTLHPLDPPRVGSGRKSLADLWRLARAGQHLQFPAQARQMDLVHINGPRLYGAWRQLNRTWRRPTVYHVHLRHSPLERMYIRRVISRDPRGVLVASGAEVAAELAWPGAAHPVALVRNAVPRASADRPFEDRFDHQARRWAVIGTISREKGTDVAVEAAALLPDAELLVFGAPSPTQRDWAAALQARAPANVRWMGYERDLVGRLSREGVQIVAVPSPRQESFSLAAVEAMAASCLTLFARTAGTDDVVGATEAPRFGDVADLAALLAASWADVKAAREVARRQHEVVQREYAPDRFGAEMRAVYDGLLAAE